MKYARLLHCQFPLSLRNESDATVSWSYWSKSGCCSAKKAKLPEFLFLLELLIFFLSSLLFWVINFFLSLVFCLSLIWIYSCWVNSGLRIRTYIFFFFFYIDMRVYPYAYTFEYRYVHIQRSTQAHASSVHAYLHIHIQGHVRYTRTPTHTPTARRKRGCKWVFEIQIFWSKVIENSWNVTSIYRRQENRNTRLTNNLSYLSRQTWYLHYWIWLKMLINCLNKERFSK